MTKTEPVGGATLGEAAGLVNFDEFTTGNVGGSNADVTAEIAAAAAAEAVAEAGGFQFPGPNH